ncbi:hypothetical protein GOODEAATRI_028573 [Goodea atripinnis]|uniref:Uncharacterized protein n=1 Tax=Goodea atripinnis TaxID=208336 RepID=A0ABV0NEG4_9TELE
MAMMSAITTAFSSEARQTRYLRQAPSLTKLDKAVFQTCRILLLWEPELSEHTVECLCSCQGVTAGSPTPDTKRLRRLVCDQNLARLPNLPSTQPACPATLLVALSFFGTAPHMGLVSHGNLLRPIRGNCQLGFSSTLPPLHHGLASSPLWSSPVASCSSFRKSKLLSCS